MNANEMLETAKSIISEYASAVDEKKLNECRKACEEAKSKYSSLSVSKDVFDTVFAYIDGKYREYEAITAYAKQRADYFASIEKGFLCNMTKDVIDAFGAASNEQVSAVLDAYKSDEDRRKKALDEMMTSRSENGKYFADADRIIGFLVTKFTQAFAG